MMTQTVSSRIHLNRSEPDRMSPGAALLLLGAIVAGFIKLILPQSASGLRWEYLYLMVGAAAVLVLDTIRAAIAGRVWAGGPPAFSQGFTGLQVGPVSSQSSQKSAGAWSIGP